MVYSVNQNRQFYVVKNVVTTTPSQEGDIQFIDLKNGQIAFKHYGKGGLTRTDLIDVDKVCYAKLTAKEDMRRFLNKATVSLSADVNGGNPIVGQDYILRIQVNNYLSPGDASKLIKSSAVHATKAMATNKKAFYDKMVESLEKNFSRDPVPMLEFESTTNGIVITEKGNQPWRLGILSEEAVNFEAYPTTVKYEGEEVIWGTVEYSKSTTSVGNGRQIADIEYFCSAERGDMFRNMGYPHNIDVKMMVDPSQEYDVLDLHYFFSGEGVQVHKSEKDITFVSTTKATLDSIKTSLTGVGITFQEKPASSEG